MRAAVTIVIIALALLIVATMFLRNTATPPATQPAANVAATTQPAPPPQSATQPINQQVESVGTLTAAPPATQPALAGVRALPAEKVETAVLGSNDPNSGYKLKVELWPWGAGVRSIALTDYALHARGEERYVVQDSALAGNNYALAARAVYLDNRPIELLVLNREGKAVPAWTLTPTDEPDSVAYTARLVAADGSPVLDIVRTYRLAKDSYDLRVEQRFVNRTGQPLSIVWEQNGQVDVPSDDAAYMGDKRVVAVGYYDLDYASRTRVYTKNSYIERHTILESHREDQVPLWPNPKLDDQVEPVWVGSLNRYFAAVVHPPATVSADGKSATIEPWFGDKGPMKSLRMMDPDPNAYNKDPKLDKRQILIALTTKPLDVPIGGTTAVAMSMYAGPREPDVFEQEPYATMGFPDNLIVYSLGGCCSFLTFQWLAHWLLAFLEGIHYVLHDWGLAIIILVLIVRLALHPLMKRGQIQMAKTGKQMQKLQPKLAELKKKYKDDQTRINQETMALYREHGVNPLNMLGCAPMLLQTPIWIALYAMLYFAIELRHEPAFYGIFQQLSGDRWMFLADLSSPDNFIQLFDEPKIFSLWLITFNYQSINILPLLMVVVFYFQQKLTAVPPANEEQARQQKMMKWMTLIFPIFLYAAPSGLTLYMCASTAAGILDSYIVRRHIKREEEEGRLFAPPKPRKPGSLQDRMAKWVEQKQRDIMEGRGPGGGSGGKGQARQRDRDSRK